jgi:transcriptional regulator
MKIKRHLPCAPFPPTKATYKKPVVGDTFKHMRVVEVPSAYNPKPAPIPKPRPKLKAYPKPPKTRGMGKREVHREPKFWTEEKVEKVIEMYENGATLQEIGNRFGKPGTSVRNLITRLSDKGLIERHHVEHYTDEDIDRMRELREAGKTYAEIGDIMGRTPAAVFNVLKRADRGKRND